MNYKDRLNFVIPGGAHTYSRGHDQFPSNAPQILEKGRGAYVWDPEGNKYLDYGMALRAVTIGYANEQINKGAYKQIENGVNLTRPSMVELKAAELLVDLIPYAEMVKFAKNGSNVTTAAVKIARAYTGRDYVCFPRQQPFFSFDDWFIGSTPITKGIPEAYRKYSLKFDYNDLNSLEKLFNEYPNEIACVIMEPATTLLPCSQNCGCAFNTDDFCAEALKRSNTFLHKVKELCHKNGSLFILDETITGFRFNLRGAQTYFNIEPDMSTFGKGMANGFSVAALVGKREFMDLGGITKEGAERLFLVSTTHGAEMPGLGALIATINFYKENNVINHLWQYGKKLFDGINDISRSLGLSDYFYMDGSYIIMNYIAKDVKKKISLKYRTLFSQEMIKYNVLMPWIAVSYAHGDKELNKTFDAVENSLKVYKKALEEGIEKYLNGPSIKPVFRKYN
ncbi:MAG: glutamate-1-semialdehyde 2,1-aminomutase [Promethearchaeota archaeon]